MSVDRRRRLTGRWHMARKVLAGMAVGATLITVAPALANTTVTRGRRTPHQRTLVLTVWKHDRAFLSRTVMHGLMVSPLATVAYQGFRCEATVGVGPSSSEARNFFTNDSVEFYFTYLGSLNSVTVTCVGQLPSGTSHAPTIVSHNLACRMFNPSNMAAPTLQGLGVSTTYPDGLFSETCNLPNFS